MNLFEFVVAILILLATPGPTNTLIFLGGYVRGWRRAMPLIGAEVAGYLTIILPIAIFAAPLLAQHPAIANAIKLVAGLWVLFLAVRLWKVQTEKATSRQVDGRQVFITTLLNPKALIITLVIMPHGAFSTVAPWIGGFVLLTFLAASCWIFAGHTLANAAGRKVGPFIVQRVAAVCLFGFSLLLTGSSLAALS